MTASIARPFDPLAVRASRLVRQIAADLISLNIPLDEPEPIDALKGRYRCSDILALAGEALCEAQRQLVAKAMGLSCR